MVEQLDRGLRTFARVVEEFNGVQIGTLDGAGAAGGLGGGFKALLGATLERGITMVLEAMHFDNIIAGSDLVITGEGRIDRQSIMGKAPSGILAAAMAQNISTIAIAGGVEWCDELRDSGFSSIEIITPDGMPLAEAMQPSVARDNIRLTAQRIAQSYR
jgi:glycerate kinase